MPRIKNADFADLPIIHDLAQRIWPYAYGELLSTGQLKYMLEKIYSLPSLQNQFNVLKHSFILVFCNDLPVGFASYSPNDHDAVTYRLHKIYVLPGQQGTGAGKLLLEHVVNRSKLSGALFLELNVNRFNKARLFYERHGFAIVGEEDIDIGGGYFMNDYVMNLALA
ncbi:MAG: GNAT family N-acetyltransferase [Ginsengibacter sp.]